MCSIGLTITYSSNRCRAMQRSKALESENTIEQLPDQTNPSLSLSIYILCIYIYIYIYVEHIQYIYIYIHIHILNPDKFHTTLDTTINTNTINNVNTNGNNMTTNGNDNNVLLTPNPEKFYKYCSVTKR